MNNGWIQRSLRNVTTKIGSGSTPKGGQASYKQSGISLIRSLNVHDGEFRTKNLAFIDNGQAKQLDNVVVEAGDVLLNITGASIARCCVAPEDVLPARVNQHVSILRPDAQHLHPRFLQYMLVSRDYKHKLLSAGEAGATRQALTKGFLEDFRVRFPESLSEQRRIVGILDEAFEGIATAKANAEKNLQNARALFESYLNAVLTQRGKGWMETTIGDQMTFQRGFDITKSKQEPGEIPVVSSGGIKSFHRAATARAPGVVIGRKGTLGKVFYLSVDYWPHDTTLWIKDFKGNHPRFVYHFLRRLDVTQLDTGTANPALNRNLLHPILTTWPELRAQAALAEVFDNLEVETLRLESIYQRKLAALDELKQSLLHQAFSGRL